MWASAAVRAGAGILGRRPGGKTGKPRRKPRKLTTSQAAIRRFEQRKRAGTGRPARPARPRPKVARSPLTRIKRAEGRPAVGGRQRTSRTSEVAIARSRRRLGTASRVRKPSPWSGSGRQRGSGVSRPSRPSVGRRTTNRRGRTRGRR